MAWAKLDDTFCDHRKTRRAGNEAIGLHVRAISHSAGHLLDGHIDPEWVEEKAGKRGKKLVEQLITAGLWEPNGDGWVIHDYLEYNPSRVDVVKRRAAEQRRKESSRKQAGR